MNEQAFRHGGRWWKTGRLAARPALALLLMAAVLAAGPATAQTTADYPNRPIRFLLISAAGSGGDTLGRLMAEKMAPTLKANFVIENRPGAGGAIAIDAAAKSAPDGYTITMGGATTHVLLPAVNPKLPYDSVKDFAAIGQIGTAAIVLIANNDFPANNLKELLALARGKPDSLQYASWGNGSTGHFCGELMNLKTGAGIGHVPYKSVAQIQTDLMGGHVKLGFVDMASGTPLVKSGRAKAIVTCTSRSPSLPGVSSYDDEGIDFNRTRIGAFRWAMYAPAGTPAAIVERLSAALKTALEQPEVKARLLELGIVAAFMPGEELRAETARDIETWRQVARDARISLD